MPDPENKIVHPADSPASAEPLRILFAMTPAFNPNDGGVQRTTYKLGKYFTESGLEVHYFSLKHTGHVVPDQGRLHHAEAKGGGANAANIARLKEVLARVRPHFVINQMPYEKPLRDALGEEKARMGFILLGCLRNSLFSVKNNLQDKVKEVLPKSVFPLFNHRVGLQILFWLHWWKHRRQLRQILDTHDRFILLTPANRQELAYFVKDYPEEKVLALPNSIPDVQRREELSKEKILLHVGRLNIPQKRSDLLLEIWQQLHPVLADWTFVVVGDGPYRKQMKNKIRQDAIPRVQLVGYQQPEPYYRKASVFLMPSAYEGFPNVILEAQSFGVVPVAFKSYPALSWIVNEQEDALLAEPFDCEALVEKIRQLAQDELLYSTMSDAALKNAGRFTIEKVGKRWITLFQQLSAHA